MFKSANSKLIPLYFIALVNFLCILLFLFLMYFIVFMIFNFLQFDHD